ncbi:MAG: hypothetical protein GY811_28760 [Myxococcales bacterium]|nr:hypothetical protein [Myxococcales bacterium]
MAAARNKRLAQATKTPASPATQPEPSDAPALPVGELDKDHIRDQMEEILPLVRGCYERTLLRRPDLEGKAVM